MAVRHIRDYIFKARDQYAEMLGDMKYFEDQAEKGMVSPDKLDQIQKELEPVAYNYQTLCWIEYLLDLPNRSNKVPRYEGQHHTWKDMLKLENSLDSLYKKGQEALERTFPKDDSTK